MQYTVSKNTAEILDILSALDSTQEKLYNHFSAAYGQTIAEQITEPLAEHFVKLRSRVYEELLSTISDKMEEEAFCGEI